MSDLDLFYCFRFDYPLFVFVKGDIDVLKFYEIDRLFNKKIFRKGKGMVIKYLIKWKGYKSEFDRWYNVKYLEKVEDLIKKYEKEVAKSRFVVIIIFSFR